MGREQRQRRYGDGKDSDTQIKTLAKKERHSKGSEDVTFIADHYCRRA